MTQYGYTLNIKRYAWLSDFFFIYQSKNLLETDLSHV